MDVQVLGTRGGQRRRAGRSPSAAGKPRALLAMLALNAGSTVSTERLIDGLWGEQPPATATKLVQVYVSQLRKALAAGGDGAEIVTRGRGYELRLGPDEVDARALRAAGRARRRRARRWRCGAARRSTTWPTSRSRPRRSAGWRSCGWRRSSSRSSTTWPQGRHREVRRRARGAGRRRAAARAAARAADAGAVPLRPAGRRARRLPSGPDRAGGGDRRRAGAGAAAAARGDPAPGSVARAAGGRAVELPPELDAGTPLAGREADLEWLRELWRGAHGGAGRLVLVAGARGIGKTRLAAALAGEVHRDRGAVLYASGAGAPDAALAALARAGAARRPTLLVLDDVDRAGEAVLRGARRARRRAGRAAGARAGDRRGRRLHDRARADATLCLAPLDAEAVRAVAELYAARRATTQRAGCRAARRGERRDPAAGASRRRRVGARRGGAAS